ncbi:hypothetical protein [Leuconostoc gasicomitatum]|uniref:hypothetical protein n=1 Tax=Leuconostoc gasicomitatum TaxID=115778 RepID=UPI001CC7931D|nr:hypothetical protein [Leuconostoc gasicomitatum]MBZ5968879.1 hypothetical protein [Leuconostoc gasicomitatum]
MASSMTSHHNPMYDDTTNHQVSEGKMTKKLDSINKKRQLLIDQLGEKKLEQSEIVLEEVRHELEVTPAQLITLTEYYRLLVLLPDCER